MKLLLFLLCALSLPTMRAQTTPPASGNSPIDALIPWLFKEDAQLRGIPFSEVIFDATGKRVLPFDPRDEIDARVLKQITGALDQVVSRMNAPDSEVRDVLRINEVSSHFEDLLRRLLDVTPGLSCEFPKTAEGRTQRSGYPDLRLLDAQSRRVYYLDPKLFTADNRDSSLRTFYFEPKRSTNKVRDDAVHFVAGFVHEKPTTGKPWKFAAWELVDLSRFKVKLKAEFEAANRDIYRSDAIIATSAK